MMEGASGWQFGDLRWGWGVGMVWVVGAVLTLRAARPWRGGLSWMLVGLRMGALTLLALSLLEPRRVREEPRSRDQAVVVLLDDSSSMAIREGEGESPAMQLNRIWQGGAAGWLRDLESAFRVKIFAFQRDVRSVSGPEMLAMKEDGSFAGDALRRVGEMSGVDRPAAVVMFTDGRFPAMDLRGDHGLPVFAVPLGEVALGRGVELSGVRVRVSPFEDSPVGLVASVDTRGVAGCKFLVRAERLSGGVRLASDAPAMKVVEEEVLIQRNAEERAVHLALKGVPPGVSFYRVAVSLREGDAKGLVPERMSRVVAVVRPEGPHRVLYMGGRPNWEFPPLRRALEGDGELQWRGVIRIARREPRFAFKGRGGEGVNPLFRGFGAKDDDVQRYDQAVNIRLNVEGSDELKEGFPRTAAELFEYKAVFLHAVETEGFSPEQIRLMQRFVTDRGGTLFVMGGEESFEGGAWRGTALESVLPVWLGGVAGDSAVGGTGPFRWELTREGMFETWLRRHKAEADESGALAKLPALDLVNRVTGIKPAASVLATVRAGDGGSVPALVTQRSGRGRSAAMLVGDAYHWALGDAGRTEELTRFWRQAVRWSTAEVPGRVDVALESRTGSDAVRVRVRVVGKEAEALEDAEVRVLIRPRGGDEAAVVALRADAEGEPGRYAVDWIPGSGAGEWEAEVVANEASGVEVGRVRTGWAEAGGWEHVAPMAAGGLEEGCRSTGGGVVAVGSVGDLVSKIAALPRISRERRVTDVWHHPLYFGVALGCLVGEWMLRRRKGYC